MVMMSSLIDDDIMDWSLAPDTLGGFRHLRVGMGYLGFFRWPSFLIYTYLGR